MMHAHTIVSRTERSTRRDTKVYAQGIGMVEDGPLELVSHKCVQEPTAVM
jgi:hypothetical protein